MSSGKLCTSTEDLWKNPDVKIIYRAALRALVKQSGVIDATARSLSSSPNDDGLGLVILDQAC
ncbi:hypothetical protein DPV78_012301 [Talaromyces pinophilus]|nr:hypothetical protein DPV78_012301 [Talaromyces pinophilus]